MLQSDIKKKLFKKDLVTKINAHWKGYYQRKRYWKLVYLARFTGHKAHSIKDEEIRKVPDSHMPLVRQISMAQGPLTLSEDQLYELDYNRNVFTFVNGITFTDGSKYTGFIVTTIENDSEVIKHGLGIQIYPDGGMYEGFWQNN